MVKVNLNCYKQGALLPRASSGEMMFLLQSWQNPHRQNNKTREEIHFQWGQLCRFLTRNSAYL